jgi:hypothetical protein
MSGLMPETLSSHSTVLLAKDQVASDLAGEVIIFNLKSGVYYGLDSVGARVWDLIQQPRTVGDIRDALLEEYEVEADRCEHEVMALLGRLAAEGLVEIRNEAAA